MKSIVSVALFVVVCASAAKLDAPKPIAILRSAQSSNIDGSYSNSFETENGIKEQGIQDRVGPKPEDIGADSRGSHSYGFQATGDHLPTPPPMPARGSHSYGFQATGDHLPTPPPMPEH